MKNLIKGKMIGGAVFGLGGAFLLPVALPLLGFTSGGVAAGSFAASIQSVCYGGATGGLFATAQERFRKNLFDNLIKLERSIKSFLVCGCSGCCNDNDSWNDCRWDCNRRSIWFFC